MNKRHEEQHEQGGGCQYGGTAAHLAMAATALDQRVLHRSKGGVMLWLVCRRCVVMSMLVEGRVPAILHAFVVLGTTAARLALGTRMLNVLA